MKWVKKRKIPSLWITFVKVVAADAFSVVGAVVVCITVVDGVVVVVWFVTIGTDVSCIIVVNRTDVVSIVVDDGCVVFISVVDNCFDVVCIVVVGDVGAVVACTVDVDVDSGAVDGASVATAFLCSRPLCNKMQTKALTTNDRLNMFKDSVLYLDNYPFTEWNSSFSV